MPLNNQPPNIVPSVYHIMLKLCPQTVTPDKVTGYLRLTSLWRLNKSCEKAQPWLMPPTHFIF